MNVHIMKRFAPRPGVRVDRPVKRQTFVVKARGTGGLAAQALKWGECASRCRLHSDRLYLFRCAYSIAGAASDAGASKRWVRRLVRANLLDL